MEYQVKYLVKAVVAVTLNADSPEKAIEQADKTMKAKGLFKSHLEYLDGGHHLAGYDNMDRWDIEVE